MARRVLRISSILWIGAAALALLFTDSTYRRAYITARIMSVICPLVNLVALAILARRPRRAHRDEITNLNLR